MSYKHNRGVKRSKKRISLLLIILVAVLLGVIAWFTLAQESIEEKVDLENSVVSSTEAMATEVELQSIDFSEIVFPTEGASAIGTLENGFISGTANSDEQRPIASITKIITALVILDKSPMKLGEPGPQITYTLADEQYYHDYVALLGTITDVTAGTQISQYQALQAMLLASSNNVADTLVDQYFDSKQEYLDYANDLLRSYGFDSTQVADTTGFSPGSVSTATELIKLGQKALQNPVIAEIVAQESATIPLTGDIPNYNMLITQENVTGIKPGLTDEAGYCLLFSFKVNDTSGEETTVIAVVAGGTDSLQYRTDVVNLYNDAQRVVETWVPDQE